MGLSEQGEIAAVSMCQYLFKHANNRLRRKAEWKACVLHFYYFHCPYFMFDKH